MDIHRRKQYLCVLTVNTFRYDCCVGVLLLSKSYLYFLQLAGQKYVKVCTLCLWYNGLVSSYLNVYLNNL